MGNKLVALIFVLCMPLSGCSDPDIQRVKEQISDNSEYTWGQLLENRKSCESYKWSSFEDSHERKIVEFICRHKFSKELQEYSAKAVKEKWLPEIEDTISRGEPRYYDYLEMLSSALESRKKGLEPFEDIDIESRTVQVSKLRETLESLENELSTFQERLKENEILLYGNIVAFSIEKSIQNARKTRSYGYAGSINPDESRKSREEHKSSDSIIKPIILGQKNRELSSKDVLTFAKREEINRAPSKYRLTINEEEKIIAEVDDMKGRIKSIIDERRTVRNEISKLRDEIWTLNDLLPKIEELKEKINDHKELKGEYFSELTKYENTNMMRINQPKIGNFSIDGIQTGDVLQFLVTQSQIKKNDVFILVNDKKLKTWRNESLVYASELLYPEKDHSRAWISTLSQRAMSL